MIPCPVCGGKTQVKETRGRRRLRWCADLKCDGRVSTVEVNVREVRKAMEE